MSHAELDESETLDDGNPQDLGERFYGLRKRLPHLNILGGGCGTESAPYRGHLRRLWPGGGQLRR